MFVADIDPSASKASNQKTLLIIFFSSIILALNRI